MTAYAPGMRIVVALGGNALLERGQVPDAEAQVANIRRAMRALAPLVSPRFLAILICLPANKLAR